jgi:N-acetyl-1-D-myo-inositol-2-amino-2-deoxy-alpha-D-glucopyranoside deacetylase
MNQPKKLIFFGAHPDDETFGLGATLAKYALDGVKVYCACATNGELGTVDPEYLKGFATIADLRQAEMACAARALGLAEVIYLGYRDSGMPGAPDNRHPKALMAAPLEEVVEKMVKIIRDLQPEVVLTHDAGGGYGHPDHIKVHQAVVKAFYAAGEPARYPEDGPAFQPKKLYFSIRPRGFLKLAVKLMPLFGQDPHRFGRNKDIDLTKMIGENYPVNAVVRHTKRSLIMRNQASACHASQGGAGPRKGPFRLLRLWEKFSGARDYFMREYPAPTKKREKDLFENLR